MNSEPFKTKDLTLAAFLKIKELKYTIEKEKGLGVFIFEPAARQLAAAFYKNNENFLAYSNAIKDLKREIKSV